MNYGELLRLDISQITYFCSRRVECVFFHLADFTGPSSLRLSILQVPPTETVKLVKFLRKSKGNREWDLTREAMLMCSSCPLCSLITGLSSQQSCGFILVLSHYMTWSKLGLRFSVCRVEIPI